MERMIQMEIMLLTVILFMWVAVCISVIRGHDLLEDIRNELEERKDEEC